MATEENTNLYRWRRAFSSAKALIVDGEYSIGEAMVMVYDPIHSEVSDAFAEVLLLVDTPRKDLSKEIAALILLSRSTHFGSTLESLVPGWHARNAELFLHRVLAKLLSKMTAKKLSVDDALRAFLAYLHLFRGWASSTPAYDKSWSVAHSLLVVLEHDRDCFIFESIVTKLTLYQALFVDRIAQIVLREENKNATTWDNAFGHICGSDALTLAFRRASTWTPSPEDISTTGNCFVPEASIKLIEEIKLATSVLSKCPMETLHTMNASKRRSFVNADGSRTDKSPSGEWAACPSTWPARLRGLTISDIFQSNTGRMVGRLGRLQTESTFEEKRTLDQSFGTEERVAADRLLASDESYLYSQLMPTTTKPFSIRKRHKRCRPRDSRKTWPMSKKVTKVQKVEQEEDGYDTPSMASSSTLTPFRQSSDASSVESSPPSKPASPPHLSVPEMELTPPRVAATLSLESVN